MSIYHFSYLWCTLIGVTITIGTAHLVILCTKSNVDEEEVDEKLLAPFARRFVSKKSLKAKEAEMSEKKLIVVTHNFKNSNVESALDNEELKVTS